MLRSAEKIISAKRGALTLLAALSVTITASGCGSAGQRSALRAASRSSAASTRSAPSSTAKPLTSTSTTQASRSSSTSRPSGSTATRLASRSSSTQLASRSSSTSPSSVSASTSRPSTTAARSSSTVTTVSTSASRAAKEPAPRSRAALATVQVAHTELGPTLVNARGLTLYMFEGDRSGASSCYGGCASVWPPLTTAGAPTAGAGVSPSLLSTTRRRSGRLQVTYDGHPLYRYAGDSQPSQVNGEGLNQFGGLWFALSPAGVALR